MTVDQRCRRESEVQDLSRDAVFDHLIPEACQSQGQLAGRGVAYLELPSLGFETEGRGMTLAVRAGRLQPEAGVDQAGLVARLSADALSDLVQDRQSTMGLAMTSRVNITSGSLYEWIRWEPALRALFDSRRVHESGDVKLLDDRGHPLDLHRSFTIDDDRTEVAHFLTEAGYAHIRGVFDHGDMDAIKSDIDRCIKAATPDDGESWWAETADGSSQAVRVLFFLEKSEALRNLVADERCTWIAGLTGDGHVHSGGAEGLVKPLGIVKGLSDLPWHKDCGQGLHSYMCNSVNVGISITGADRTSGALGVVAGSHRANTAATMLDPALDLPRLMLETATGDLTLHCSDTLHRAHPPTERSREVVYSGFRLPAIEGDIRNPNPRYNREARADLTTVTDRIEAADNSDAVNHYRADKSATG